MTLFKSDKILWIVTIFLIIQNYIPSELFFILGLIYILYYIIFKDDKKIFIPLKEYKILILFFIWGLVVGLVSYITGSDITARDVIRDIFYFLNPLIFIYIGAIYAKKDIDIYKIFNAFILAGGILSILQLGNTFLNFAKVATSFSVQSWRNVTGDGIMVASISIAIILSGIIPKEKRLSKVTTIFLLIVMMIEFLITLSRTNLLVFFIMYFILSFKKDNNKINKKNILIFFAIILVLAFLVFIILPEQIRDSYINKLLSTKSEISSNHSWTTLAEIQGNWRGYETYCGIEEWKNSNILKQIIGHGFGKRIYVGEYAYTLLNQTDENGRPMDTIAVLHNGYATMLLKLGVLGVVLYIGFYLLLIKKAIKGMRKLKDVESKSLFSVAFIFLIQTYFLNGLYKDYCFYPLVILIGYTGYKIQKKMNRTEN